MTRNVWAFAAVLAIAAAPAAAQGADASAPLRAQVAMDLRRAGVPESCIASLDRRTLLHVRSLTVQRTRTGREALKRRQQLRSYLAPHCPDL